MTNNEFELILNTLKDFLKKRKVSYKKISQKTGIPLSTLKKSLAGQDITIKRIIKICESVDISFFDLFEIIRNKNNENIFLLSSEQEVFFAKNPIYYLFFNKIFREKNSINEAKKYFDLSQEEVTKILTKLEQFKLLSIESNDKVSINVVGGIKFIKNGALNNLILEKSSTGLLDHLLTATESENELECPYLRLNFSQLTTKTINELTSKIQQIHQEFANRSILERRIFDKNDLKPVSWLLGVGECNAIEFIQDGELGSGNGS